MQDAQLVSVVCSATDDSGQLVDREVNVTVTAISSADVAGGDVRETTYQLVLFDAVEGGIEIAPASRELSTASNSSHILTATVTVNAGAVRQFEELNVLEGGTVDHHTEEVNSGEEAFVVEFPRYYYEVMIFTTRRLR